MNGSPTYLRALLGCAVSALLAAALSAPARADANDYWQNVRASISMHDLATDGSIYVGGGSNGIWFSRDLKTWSRGKLPLGINRDFNAISYAHGKFFALSDTILTSSDGITWSTADMPVALPTFQAVTYGNGLFVAVGEADIDASILTSTDGRTWTSQPSGIPSTGTRTSALKDIAWNGERFVATGAIFPPTSPPEDVIVTSPDGKNWTSVGLPSDGLLQYSGYAGAVAYGNGIFVAGGVGGVYTSTDGLTWTANILPFDFSATSIQFVNGHFIAPGVSWGLSGGNPQTGFLYSTDGTSWAFATARPDEEGRSLAGFVFTDRGYVMGADADVWTSPDLSTWTVAFAGPQSNQMLCLAHGDDAGYVVVGFPGTGTLTSMNGRDWPDDEARAGWIYAEYPYLGYSDGCIVYGSDRYVNQKFYSADGKTWTSATVPSDEQIRLVAYNGSSYLGVVGYENPTLLTSQSASVWSQINYSLPEGFQPYAVQGLSGLFFMIGRDSDDQWVILRSPDGGVWQDVTPPAPYMDHPHITYGDRVFVAMWTEPFGKLGVAWSTDTQHWVEAEELPADLSFVPTSITYGGGTYLAVGYDPKTQTGAQLVSRDGKQWAAATYDSVSRFNTVLWDGTKFVATTPYNILNAPGVMLNVSASAPESVEAGEKFTYTILVSNAGDIAAGDVVLRDSLPTNADLAGYTTTQGSGTSSDGLLVFELGTIEPGKSTTVKVSFTARSGGGVANRTDVYALQPMQDNAEAESRTIVHVKEPVSTSTGSDSSGGGGGAFGVLAITGLICLALRRRMTSGE